MLSKPSLVHFASHRLFAGASLEVVIARMPRAASQCAWESGTARGRRAYSDSGPWVGGG
jgi:hypothetical protein